MTAAPKDTAPADRRPATPIRPTCERALRAIAALEDHRVEDAEKHIAASSDSPMMHHAWKTLLCGLVRMERANFREAEASLLQACSLALVCAYGCETEPQPEALRLAAKALNHLGRIYRRQDRSGDACRTHLAAYGFCSAHGSFDELWETASELALDARIARRYDEAAHWHQEAIAAGEHSAHEPFRKQAAAWTDLSISCSEAERHAEAVSAARKACDCWQKHDLSAINVAQADLRLGAALLKLGASLHDRHDPHAATVLQEADERLLSARQGLLAFGPQSAADARSAAEQIDLAKRLLASLVA